MNNEQITTKKSFFESISVTKIIGSFFGILSGLLLLYFAIENLFKPYMEQLKMINDQIASGAEVPFMAAVMPIYVLLALVCVLVIAPIVGSLLPVKFKSASIILLMIPFSWNFVDVLPTLISAIAQKVPFADIKVYYILAGVSLCSLVASILTAVSKKAEKAPAEEIIVYEEDYQNEAAEEFVDAEEVIEEAEAIEETEEIEEVSVDEEVLEDVEAVDEAVKETEDNQ